MPVTYAQLLFPAWTCVMGFVLGAFVGSFLNMAIYRLPRLGQNGLSFTEPKRSICPSCNHPLYSADLMPIFSWLFLKGKCRYCRKPVSARYVFVELLAGSLFAGIWYQYLTASYEPIRAGFYALFAACLIAVCFIDAELYIIPDELNALLLILAVAYHAIEGSFGVVLPGMLWGWGLIFGIALLGRIGFGKGAMGGGDTKMMRGVGAMIGPWLLIGNLAIAVVAGLVGGLLSIALSKKGGTPATESEGDGAEEGAIEATPIKTVVICGLCYLFCLDIFALFLPKLRKWFERFGGVEETEEDQIDWTPAPTAIPFGPYLAVGALVCMLFATALEHAIKAYFHAG